jgi:dipeptidyl aminopeptidase/acylaminoacyl peptidase
MQLWIQSVTETEIGILSLETGQVRSLVQAVNGRFLPNGDVAYVTSNGDLLVAPFDEKTMTFTAPGSVVERGVRIDNWAGAAMFDVSRTGHLMYAPSGEQETDRVVWVDRDGKVELVDPEWGGPFVTPTLSPDGKKLVVVVETAGGTALWTKDLSGGLPSQLTIGRGPFASPAWSPDSRRVAFVSFASIPSMISSRNVDGSGQAEQLSLPLDGILSMTWAPDGRLVYSRERSGGEVDIGAWHPDRDSTERVVVDVDGRVSTPAVSPDGRWIAYALANQMERNVWVTRFPDGGDDVWPVTVDGGSEPAWAHSGRELFYRTPGGDLMSRRIDVVGDVIRLGEVVSLFDASRFQSNPGEREYDVALDDQRFLMIQTGESRSTLTLVYNWLDALETMLGQ